MKVTIEDPGVLTKPWVINRTTTLETGFEMTEYVCNENNQDPGHLDATLKRLPRLTLSEQSRRSNGVPPVQATKAPAPPAGPTPRTPEGKVDFSGVWVPTSTCCRAIRRINLGQEDLRRAQSQQGQGRSGTLLPAQWRRSGQSAALQDRAASGDDRAALGRKHSQLSAIFPGRPRSTISTSSLKAGQDSRSASGTATRSSSIRWASTTRPGWTRPASLIATPCI